MGFLGGLGGVLTGIGERAHEHNLIEMEQRVNMHNQLRDSLNQIAENPILPPEMTQAARQKWLEISATPAHKFKPKDAQDIQQFVGQAAMAARRAQVSQVSTPSAMPAEGPTLPPGPPQPPAAAGPLPSALAPQWLPTGEAPGAPAFMVERPTPPFSPPPMAGAEGAAVSPSVLTGPAPAAPPPPSGIEPWMSEKTAYAMRLARAQAEQALRAEQAKLDVEAKASLKKLTDLAKEYEKAGMEPERALLAAQGHMPQPKLIISPFDGSVWNAVTGKQIKEGSGVLGRYNSQMVTIRVPGQPDQMAFSDPRRPGTYYSQTGEPIVDLPPEAQVVPYSVVAAQERGLYYGEFGGYYRAGLGRGLSREDAMKFGSEMLTRKYGVTLSRAEQDIAIKAELSGIGGRPSGPAPIPPPPGPSPSVAPTSAPRPSQEAPPAAPSERGPGLLTQRDRSYVNQYIGSLFGTLPGRGQAAQVGIKRGLEILARQSGLDPLTLNAALVDNKAAAKQLAETVQRQGAIQRLANTIELHGKVVEQTAKSLQDTGSPLFNRPVREWRRKFVGSPELKRFQMALNAVQREYTYLTVGGGQSRAMLPVTMEERIGKMLSEDSTMAEVAASMSQLGIEAERELAAMTKTRQDIIGMIQSGPIGKTVGAPPAAPPSSTGAAPKTAEEYLKARGIR